MVRVGYASSMRRFFKSTHRLDPTKKAPKDEDDSDDSDDEEEYQDEEEASEVKVEEAFDNDEEDEENQKNLLLTSANAEETSLLPILKCCNCSVSFASKDIVIRIPSAFRAHKAYVSASRPLMTSQLEGHIPNLVDDMPRWRDFYGPVKYVHLDCWQYWYFKPYKSMFDGGGSLSYTDRNAVYDKISTWQTLYNQRIKHIQKFEAQQLKKREQELKKQQKELAKIARSRKSSRIKKQKARALDDEEAKEELPKKKRMKLEEETAQDGDNDADPYMLGLSSDVWSHILGYLNVPEILRSLALVSKGMYQYTILDSIWEVLGIVNLSSSYTQIRLEHCPEMTYREAYRVCMGHICESCGDYCSNREYNYFYPLDCVICAVKCQKLPQYKLLNKGEATKIHKRLVGHESLRSIRKNNPFHPSTAMFQFVACEIKFLKEIYLQEELVNHIARKLDEKNIQLDNGRDIQRWIDEERRKGEGLLYDFIYQNETNTSVYGVFSTYFLQTGLDASCRNKLL